MPCSAWDRGLFVFGVINSYDDSSSLVSKLLMGQKLFSVYIKTCGLSQIKIVYNHIFDLLFFVSNDIVIVIRSLIIMFGADITPHCGPCHTRTIHQRCYTRSKIPVVINVTVHALTSSDAAELYEFSKQVTIKYTINQEKVTIRKNVMKFSYFLFLSYKC